MFQKLEIPSCDHLCDVACVMSPRMSQKVERSSILADLFFMTFFVTDFFILFYSQGEIVTLTRKVDQNWYEGISQGRKGILPAAYLEVAILIFTNYI